MILLDTNVISELMRTKADATVRAWLADLPATPATTVVNRAEVMAGVALLPPGARAERLRRAAATAFSTLGACLPLTTECADHYADIVAARRRLGRPIGGMDALIAAIAREAGATIATRDVQDFAGLDITVVNPWVAD